VNADDVSTWAPVASATAAALAAGASWISVRLSRKQWKAAQRPELRLQAWDRGGTIEIVIVNAGGGFARGVGFCVVVGTEYVAGFAGPNLGGFLDSGQRVVVNAQLTRSSNQVQGVVTCHDVDGFFHAWDAARDQHRVWRGRFTRRALPADPSGQEALNAFYPSLDLGALTRVEGTTPRAQFGLPA
jgi:hypothetical protein